MMELTIDGVVYNFNFGYGFMKELNPKVKQPVDGIPGRVEEIGMKYEIARLLDGNIEALVNILMAANKGQTTRLTGKVVEAYIEDPDTDIDNLFDEVKDFLSKANVTRKDTLSLLKLIEEQ